MQPRPLVLIVFALLLFVLPAPAQPAPISASPDNACAKLQHLSLRQAHVLSAEAVEAGAFVALAGAHGKVEPFPIYSHLPEFCRVVVDATPSPDSHIKIEVWLPVSGWNKRLQGVGNGGFAGSIDYRQMATSVLNGFSATG
ncbi:MAG: tannase/feruloyl esterase family alpha/beta hydrolase, partial [Acidobacteriaceae bacterium]|nr:tannase/feruloyl esterase family alpha/beta hydrolase [Acidobacteriaceae bacterium]